MSQNRRRNPERVLQFGGNRNGVWPKSVICRAQNLRSLPPVKHVRLASIMDMGDMP